jgi:hypothetical protein
MPTRRRERNQQLFRQVNERIREVGAGFDVTLPDGLDFICECGEASCADILQLTLQEYEQLPRTGPYFIVKPGHHRSSQRVVRRTAEYVLVEDLAYIGEPPGASQADRAKL